MNFFEAGGIRKLDFDGIPMEGKVGNVAVATETVA